MHCKECIMLCTALLAVEVFGGSIKPTVPAEVQEVITEIDVTSLLLEREVQRAIIEQKHDADATKLDVKLAIKHLKTAIKTAKGTVCGQIASVEAKALEGLAANAKACSQSAELKELEGGLYTYLKNLHSDALLIDPYCRFMHPAEEVAACVAESVDVLKDRLANAEASITTGIAAHTNASQQCYKTTTDEVHAKSEVIQTELQECLNPSTTPSPTAGAEETTETDHSRQPEHEGTGETAHSENAIEDSKSTDDQKATDDEVNTATPAGPSVVPEVFVDENLPPAKADAVHQPQDEDEVNVEY